MWANFKAGVTKGPGMTVGMTAVLGLAVWVLTILIDVPFAGEYFAEAKEYITEYAENINYKDDFSEMNQLLTETNEGIND